MGESFSDRFCKRYGVVPQRVAPSLLSRTFREDKIPVKPLLRVLPRDLFRNDLEFLRMVSRCASMDELINVLRSMPAYYGSSWKIRDRMGLRVSGRRLIELGKALFKDA